jgi:hypothetical protein
MFVAVAAGISIGRETGTVTLDEQPMPVASHVARLDVTGETYVRIGIALGR